MSEIVWHYPYCPAEKGWNAPSLSHCKDCGEIKPLAVALLDAPEWMSEAPQTKAKRGKSANKGEKAPSKKQSAKKTEAVKNAIET